MKIENFEVPYKSHILKPLSLSTGSKPQEPVLSERVYCGEFGKHMFYRYFPQAIYVYLFQVDPQVNEDFGPQELVFYVNWFQEE